MLDDCKKYKMLDDCKKYKMLAAKNRKVSSHFLIRDIRKNGIIVKTKETIENKVRGISIIKF